MLFVFSRLCVNGSLGHDAVFDAVHVIRQPLNILQGLKALSWGNLRNEMSAYVQRYYLKVVF